MSRKILRRPATPRRAQGPHKRPGESALTEELKTKATALLADHPRPSYSEIGRVLGVHWQVIQRLARKVGPQIESAQKALDEYGRRLPRALPVKERVRIYSEIARRYENNPAAAQRALE